MSKFENKTVLTLDSTIGPMKLPKDSKMLRQEDSINLVPGMAVMNNVTLRSGLRDFPEPVNAKTLESGGFGRVHLLENYRDSLSKLQCSPNEEARSFINIWVLYRGDAAAEFLTEVAISEP